jgi:hypothetical protein
MNSLQIKTVQDLADFMVAVDVNRAKVKAARAAGERISEGVAPEYLPALIGFVYNEFLEIYMQPGPWDDEPPDWAFPEELILDSLFDLFLNHLDEDVVRTLFARFAPMPPRVVGAQREKALLELYLRQHMPPKARFARRVAEYNKTVPRERRLGSRSTSEISMLKYVERMLKRHPKEVELHRKFIASNPRMVRLIDPEESIKPPEMPARLPTDGFGHYRRKMSRQI